MEKVFAEKMIAYAKEGHGPVVVLIHGFGENSTIWHNQVMALNDACTLIVPDLRGSGNTTLQPAQEESLTIESMADDIYALLQHEKAEQCIVIGHSMGGYVALAFAAKYPDRLAGFGLVHSTAFADSTEKKANRDKGIEHIKNYGGYSFLKTSIPNLFAEGYRETNAAVVADLIEQSRQFSDNALIAYYKAMKERPDRTSVLRSLRIPTLFIAGTHDVAAPLQDVLQQVHLPAVAHIHILGGVGHMGMWEAAEQVNKHLLDFIAHGLEP